MAHDHVQGSDAFKVLHLLHGGVESGYLEFRLIHPETRKVRQLFFPVQEREDALDAARRYIETVNVFYGVAPRTRRGGGKDAIDIMPAVWAEIDRPEAAGALALFEAPPSFVIASGTEGHLHAYWVLEEPIGPSEAEELNRGLAAQLGADSASVDASRVLRLPGTYNHKTKPPTKVTLVDFDGRRHRAEQLQELLGTSAGGGRPQPQRTQGAAPTVTRSAPVQRVLDRLDGVAPTRSGWQALCPAHDDRNPSLSIAEGDDGRCLVWCFAGCTMEEVVAGVSLDPSDLFPDDGSASRSVSVQLVDLVDRDEVFLFHDDLDQAFAWVPQDGHREVWRVSSRKFKRWLRGRFHEETDRVAPAQAVADAVEVLCARAEFKGPKLDVFVRVAGHQDSVLIDLADEAWRAIEVKATGWTVREDPSVPFLRRGSTLALPEPERGGSVEELRAFLNLPDEHAWRLLVAFLVMSMQDRGPYPLLILLGEPGSAKSTAARLLRLLLDPAKAPLRAGSPNERDLMIMASGSWIVGFDNVRQVTDRLSDALCQLSTGAGLGLRELYTDAEEVIFEAMRPAILNGIAGIAERPDLISRSIVLTLPAIADTDREAEEDFWGRFEEARPRIGGALLDLLSKVLALRPGLTVEGGPRMADFARVGVAVEQALGWPKGAFLEAYDESQGSALTATLDSDPVSSVTQSYLRKYGEFSGTATELLAALTAQADEKVTRQRNWPPNAAQLAKRLKGLAPALRKVGVEVTEHHAGRGGGKRRGLELRLIGDDGDAGDG